ncbi:MAG: hypothetical protein J7L80_04035 [Thermoplasmata archaeon]|nr:hypothetical protein [Thermoplasmata archaeon]
MQKLCIICGNSQAEAKIVDKNPKTAEAILKRLPLEGTSLNGERNIIFTLMWK